MAEQTKKRSMTTNLKLKLKWGPKTHLQLQIITIGATKDNEMKIFEIITLSSLIWFSCNSKFSQFYYKKKIHFLSQTEILCYNIWQYFLCHCFGVQAGPRTRRQKTSTIAPLRLAGFSECSRRSSVTLPYSTQERAGLGRYLNTFIHTKRCMCSSCILVSLFLYSNSQQTASFPLHDPSHPVTRCTISCWAWTWTPTSRSLQSVRSRLTPPHLRRRWTPSQVRRINDCHNSLLLDFCCWIFLQQLRKWKTGQDTIILHTPVLILQFIDNLNLSVCW